MCVRESPGVFDNVGAAHERDPRGFGDGDRVRIGNAQGSVVLHARLFDGVQPTTVIVE